MQRSVKHGGELARIDLDVALVVGDEPREDLLELDELLEQLAGEDPRAAELVKLRSFVGLTGRTDRRGFGHFTTMRCGPVMGLRPRLAFREASSARLTESSRAYPSRFPPVMPEYPQLRTSPDPDFA